MIKLISDTMQVLDRYHKAYFRHDASCWCIWKSLFDTECKLFLYMIKVIWDSMQVVDVYDQAYFRQNASCWCIW